MNDLFEGGLLKLVFPKSVLRGLFHLLRITQHKAKTRFLILAPMNLFEIFSSIGMKIIKQSALLITETIDVNFFLKFCSLYVTCATMDVVTVKTLAP